MRPSRCSTPDVRAVVVPGHGHTARDGVRRISPRCLGLVREAETLLADVVVFSGRNEAEQMRDAWRGPDVELVVEPTARTTVENATRTLPLLLERGVSEAVVVCAPTHVVRVALFFGRIYGARSIDVHLHTARLPVTPRAIAWELAALPLVPAQLRIARTELDRRLT
jgi:uncharacterized SAM-binding protein YcdF (DUF218 family)